MMWSKVFWQVTVSLITVKSSTTLSMCFMNFFSSTRMSRSTQDIESKLQSKRNSMVLQGVALLSCRVWIWCMCNTCQLESLQEQFHDMSLTECFEPFGWPLNGLHGQLFFLAYTPSRSQVSECPRGCMQPVSHPVTPEPFWFCMHPACTTQSHPVPLPGFACTQHAPHNLTP